MSFLPNPNPTFENPFVYADPNDPWYQWPGPAAAPPPTAAPPSPSAAPPPPGPAAPAPAPAPPPAPPAGPAALSGEQQSIYDRIRGFLTQFNLGEAEMLDWIRTQLIGNATEAGIMLDLLDPSTVPGKIVDRTYPEIRGRREANLPPISIADALSYRDNAIQLMRAANLPAGFYDEPADLAKFQIRDVSLAELKTRIDTATVAAFNAPPETRQQLQTLYSYDLGHLSAFYLDPDKALPLLQQQFASAQIAGVGQRTRFGQLSAAEAERLAALGISDQAAEQGFGQLVQSRELFGVLPGQRGATVSRAEQLGAAFGGDAAAQEKIRRKAAAQQALFGAGGTFAAEQKGLVGLGSAAT